MLKRNPSRGLLAVACGCLFTFGLTPAISVAQADHHEGESGTSTELHPVAAEVKTMLGDRDPGKTFVLAVEFQIKPNEAKAFIAAMKKCVPPTRKESGNIAYLLMRSPTEKDSFALFERWKSLDDLDKHLKQPYLEEFLEAAEPLMAAPPKLTVMHPVFFPKK